ncbi:uncharacterized protein KLLA0_F20614g [Kluyveromyces lactis]|uniref:KLLA0F20614p n=1 Tax=Kluyveromyces lactis (strain ATCC 8585 / CBS 2359 / DSM 70799 / NBRC 1267 / NRRL Y-1140 / WM37) TaxID=284590 RepID=Q6CJ84_KLULA|nr:uncharacterized protein KLLA0_F20614g [Kluyveromyces lactis]CAG98713.1 KLLA0F20614p [Kluyveromyces lactis]|eukprot:XP_456005.1 uncharacterized protein KLLA0_F20614g [Kluyveromyces lactis]
MGFRFNPNKLLLVYKSIFLQPHVQAAYTHITVSFLIRSSECYALDYQFFRLSFASLYLASWLSINPFYVQQFKVESISALFTGCSCDGEVSVALSPCENTSKSSKAYTCIVDRSHSVVSSLSRFWYRLFAN